MPACEICGVKRLGPTTFCRAHKFAVRRARARLATEGLTLCETEGAWCVLDASGATIVTGASKASALVALDVAALKQRNQLRAEAGTRE